MVFLHGRVGLGLLVLLIADLLNEQGEQLED
jgi:hypothetical protein